MPLQTAFGPQFTRAYTARGDWTSEPPGNPIPMIASTPGRKRDGLDLRPDRWRVNNFHRAGGPILWQHDHKTPPIGNGRASVGTDKLRVPIIFDQEDDFARKIESKLRRGVLNAASCGWDFVDMKTGEVIQSGRAYAPQLAREAAYDLSEVSIVAVPADPMATAERHWNALRSIHPGLAELYRAQEREDSDMTAEQIRAAVLDYWRALGLPPIDGLFDEGDDGYVRRSELAELLRNYDPMEERNTADVDDEDDDDFDDEEDEDMADDEDVDEDDDFAEFIPPQPAEQKRTVPESAARSVLDAFSDVLKPVA